MEEESGEGIVSLPECALYLKSIPGKGRGVYAGENLSAGRLIHISPLLLFPSATHGKNDDSSGEREEQKEVTNEKIKKEECQRDEGRPCCVEKETLSHYTYTWDSENQALALGLGSMFNHSKYPNVGFVINKEKVIISYTTLRDVRRHEELCISYGNKLWFEDLGRYSEISEGIETVDNEDFLMKGLNFDDP